MFKNVLVPLDGSPLSEAALAYAEALARRTDTSLTLVRAVHVRSPLGDPAIDQQRAIMDAEDYLTIHADALAERGINVQIGVPFGGSVASWIVEECDLRAADLIVMATHDRIGPDRWVHGSVAENVVNRSTTPVLLVHGKETASLAARFASPQPVLIVPLDGSDLAEAALPLANEFARAIKARIVLFGVIPRPGQLVAGQAVMTYVAADHAAMEAEAWAYLEASVGRAGAGDVSVEPLLRYGEPATEIAALATETGATAVVMATHGRTGLVRSILGSVAGGVLHRSEVPVLLIRPADLRLAEQPIVRTELATPMPVV
jgi:nucleotide-binding universal stress UspA family protein